jgi:hypothetical protein
MVRTMLYHKQMPKRFWAEALSVATHVRNRVTTRGLRADVTPFELLYKRKPNMSYFRVFGSKCWYNLRRPEVDKLDPRAREALMIGYARGIRGYKLWDVTDHKVVVSRDVQFNEDDHNASTIEMPSDSGDDPKDKLNEQTVPTSLHNENPSPVATEFSDHANPILDDGDEDTVDPDYAPDSPGSAAEDEPSELSDMADQIPVSPRRPTRQRRKPGAWWTGATAFVSNATSADPKTFAEAVASPAGPEWMKSMTSEYESLMENKCWEIVPRPPNTNVVSSKWIYKTKEEQTSSGALGSRLKSRLVARGFSQIEGIDYSETYAPVVKFTSVRVILAICAALDLDLEQMDAITAFLNGELDELVFMEQPEGFEQGDRNDFVCKLLKAIYGLKQAPRQWYAKIDDFFVQTLGMQRNPADDCVYVRRKAGHLLIIALYVDDLLIACSDKATLVNTKRELSSRFKMKDLGESKIILGMDISRDRAARTLSLCQSRYAQKVIDRFGLTSARGQSTPMDVGIDLLAPSPVCDKPYHEAVGSLMYLMVGTRPDLAYYVGVLAKYVSKPTTLQWNALTRVLRYVIHTKNLGLVYRGTDGLHPTACYVDADWAGDRETRKSMSGFVAMMSGAAVAWCARPQEVVALSSAESEYISMCAGAKEVTWLRRLVHGLDVGIDNKAPTVMHVDNQAAIALAQNYSVNRRNKHIDVRFHFIRDAVQNGVLKLEYCSTDVMIADMLTKSLGRIKLESFVKAIGLLPSQSASSQ